VADCLETVEEIAIRARDAFVQAGGEDLRLIPSLNSNPAWVETVAGWIRKTEVAVSVDGARLIVLN
jgi:ferrochelatase